MMNFNKFIHLQISAGLLCCLISASVLHGADVKSAASINLRFINANPSAETLSPSTISVDPFFFKNDSSTAGEEGFTAKCAYKDLYPEIDLVCHGDEYALEYIFLVKPTGDPSRILMNFDKTTEINLNNTGKITYTYNNVEISQSRPVIFEHTKDTKRQLKGSRNLRAFKSTVGLSPSESFDDQVSNNEFLQFLNDTEANPKSDRAANMVFRKNGNVWMNRDFSKTAGKLFNISASNLIYDSEKPKGYRFTYVKLFEESNYYKDRPVAGVSWFGAVKFSNWLTTVKGLPNSSRHYQEGSVPSAWSKPPESGWNSHFFSITQLDDNQGYKIDTAYSPQAILTIHILLNFYSTKPAVETIADKTKLTNEDDYVGGSTDFVNPEKFVSDTTVTFSPDDTSTGDEYKDDKSDEIIGRKSANQDRIGIIRIDNQDDDDQGEDDDDGGGGGGGGGGGPAIPPNPPDYKVTISSINAAGGVLILVSTADITGATDGTTTFQRTYPKGTNTTVTFTAAAASFSGNPFREWRKNGVSIGTNLAETVIIDSSMSLQAVYTQLRNLTILSTSPDNNVNITVTPNDINNDNDVITAIDFNRIYADGTSATLTAEPVAFNGATFLQWVSSLGPTYSSNTVNITMNSDITMTAQYINPRTLTVESENPDNGVTVNATTDINTDSTVLTVPGGVTRVYLNNQSVTLTAEPQEPGGNRFTYWRSSLGGPNIYSTNVTFTITSDLTMTARYDPLRELTVNSTDPNAGALITVTPTDAQGNSTSDNTLFKRYFLDGTVVTNTAVNLIEDGYTFIKWQLDGLDHSTNQTTTVTMDANHSLVAIYIYIPPDIDDPDPSTSGL